MWLSVALTIALPWGPSAEPSTLVAASWDASVVVASAPSFAKNTGSVSEAGWSLVNRRVPLIELQVRMTRDAVPVVARSVNSGELALETILFAEAKKLGWASMVDMLEGNQSPSTFVVRLSQEGSGAAAINALAKSGARRRVMFLIRDPEVLRYAKNKIPESFVFWEADRAFGGDDIEDMINRLVLTGADGIATTEKRIHPAMARALRQRGYPLMALDVTPGNSVERLRDLGVNLLRADEPETVREDLKALAGQRPWHFDW